MDPKIVSYFRSVDRDNSGYIHAEELQGALSNGIGTPFDITCLSLMISIFDQDNNGTISLNEFEQLFKYITDWQNVFRQHDRDCSGSIDIGEFTHTLKQFGYNLSPNFIQWLFSRFNKQRSNKLGFDKYVHILVCLQILTRSFSTFDTQRRGVATMSFEQFLGAAFNVCV
nr:programmed cell death protein [Hymenolepis microstoma]